jgi:hypothetical protein
MNHYTRFYKLKFSAVMDLWNKLMFCMMQHVFCVVTKNKFYLSRYNWPCSVFLILLVLKLVFVWWGFLFPIVVVSLDIFSLCHTSIKPDFLAFRESYQLCYGLLDHLINRSVLLGVVCGSLGGGDWFANSGDEDWRLKL